MTKFNYRLDSVTIDNLKFFDNQAQVLRELLLCATVQLLAKQIHFAGITNVLNSPIDYFDQGLLKLPIAM